jgi:hypothetical protein
MGEYTIYFDLVVFDCSPALPSYTHNGDDTR